MDLLRGRISAIYFRYLGAAFGSAMISSIYGIVDMAIVGQYQGPDGTAALAVVAPVWNIIYSLGLLAGIGGGVLFSVARGQGGTGGSGANDYFSAAFIGTVIFSALSWAAIVFFDRRMLLLFGADETLLPLARQYLWPVKFAVPVFIFNQMLAAFLRNDGSPGLATAAVLFGGLFNVAGDYFFVFTMDMGIMGAGLATAIGAALTLAAMLGHFFSKRNTLRLVRPRNLFIKLRKITVTGFSTFFIDIAMGILTVLFNRQIMRYSGTEALAVYGVIVNISTVVQCCAYSIGQASQPIISINFGAGRWGRIRATLRYALATAAFFSIAWTAAALAFPNGCIDSALHHPLLRPFVPAAAAEYLLHLLLPVPDAAGDIFLRLRLARYARQRFADPLSARRRGSPGPLARDARHRTAGLRRGGLLHDPLHA